MHMLSLEPRIGTHRFSETYVLSIFYGRHAVTCCSNASKVCSFQNVKDEVTNLQFPSHVVKVSSFLQLK